MAVPFALVARRCDEQDAAYRSPQILHQASARGAKSVGRNDC